MKKESNTEVLAITIPKDLKLALMELKEEYCINVSAFAARAVRRAIEEFRNVNS